MSLALVPMLGYSTGNDTREDLQLKWQCRNAQLGTWQEGEMSARMGMGKRTTLCKHEG